MHVMATLAKRQAASFTWQDWGVLKPYAQNWSHIGEDPRTKKLIEALKGALPTNP
jgi:hypothetical protein